MHVLELRVREAGGLYVERDHFMPAVEKTPRDSAADAGTAPGDDRGAQRKSWIDGSIASQLRMSTRFSRMRSRSCDHTSVCQAVAA